MRSSVVSACICLCCAAGELEFALFPVAANPGGTSRYIGTYHVQMPDSALKLSCRQYAQCPRPALLMRRSALCRVAGSGGSYSSLGPPGRSTSVPRPSSRSGVSTHIPSSDGASGGVSHGANSAAAGATSATVTHSSPRSASRPQPPVPSSILDSLATPPVLSGGGTRSSLALRMNNSSIMDYNMLLGGGASSSAVR